MFLGAGSVILAMYDETDMRRFGGLRAFMPVTFVTFGLGYLAIIGVPPFSGFFSKDKIIEVAFAEGGLLGAVLGIAALLGAGLTAFYMSRVMIMTFFGEHRWEADADPHEAPHIMTWPMIVLAVGSVGAGGALVAGGSLEHWLEPVVGEPAHGGGLPVWLVTVLTLAVVAAGVYAAYRQYATRPVAESAPADVSSFTTAARRDLYGDTVNEAVFMRPGRVAVVGLEQVESRGIDGTVTGTAVLIGAVSRRLRLLQTGFVRSYALYMFGGATIIVAALMLVRM